MIKENQLVQTIWNNFTKKYYVNKGYKFTKIFDIFYVDIKDLKENSNAKIICYCDYCGEEIIRINNIANRYEHHFCNNTCRGLFQAERIEVTCNTCEQHFYKRPSETKGNFNFCDTQCRTEYFIKNNPNPKKDKIISKCEVCRETKEVFQSVYDKNNNKVFCTQKCFHIYLNEIRKSRKETKPEYMVRKYLEKNNIHHIPQEFIKDKFFVDFLINENIILEVFGDYWHGNPLFFGENCKRKLNDMQIKQIKKDKSRIAYLKKCGFQVYVIWENDIYKNIEQCIEIVIKNIPL